MYDLSEIHRSKEFDFFEYIIKTGQFFDNIILTDFLKFFILGKGILNISLSFWEFKIVFFEWLKLKEIFFIDFLGLLRVVKRLKDTLICCLFAVFRAIFIIEFIGPFICICNSGGRVFSIFYNCSLSIDIFIRKRDVFLFADWWGKNSSCGSLLSTHWFYL